MASTLLNNNFKTKMHVLTEASDNQSRHLPLLNREIETTRLIYHSNFRIACDTILGELFNDRHVAVVTGPSGTGKTCLLHELMRVLNAAGWQVTLHVNSDPAEPLTADAALAAASPRALLIDDADRLDTSVIQRIIQSQRSAVVVAGLDSLIERLPTNTHVRLAPLTASESADFVGSWVVQAGHRPDLLSGEVLVRTVEVSRGIPRLLSAVLSEALWRAGTRPTLQVSVDDIESAASGPDFEHARPKPSAPGVNTLDTTSPNAPELVLRTGEAELPLAVLQPESAINASFYPEEQPRRLAIARVAIAVAAGVVFGTGVGLIGRSALAWLALPPTADQADDLTQAPGSVSPDPDANDGRAVTSPDPAK